MKSKFVFLLLILFTSNLVNSQTTFVHCATPANTNGSLTQINHPAINNNGELYLFVQKVRVDDNGTIVSNPHNISVFYDSPTGKWLILNEGGDDMPVNSCYMITAREGLPGIIRHDAEFFTILPGYANVSVIDIPVMNDNPSARSIVTKVHVDGVTNDNPAELYYNWLSPGSWYISIPPGQDMPIGAGFNIFTNLDSFTSREYFTVYEHESTLANTDSEVNGTDDYAYWTILDHEQLNNNPNAILFVTHRREPATTFIYRSFSVFYNSVTGKWQLHIELENYISDFSFPIGNLFDIFIFDSTIGIDDFTQNKDVKIFPNPANTMFNIKANGNIAEVFLYNLIGQEIEKISGINENTSKIDIANYQSGIYFVKVKTEDSFETIKLIKN